MRYCPYCGADLPVGAFSFCPVCGNPLKDDRNGAHEERKPRKKKTGPRKKKKRPSRRQPSDREKQSSPKPDDGYDGYYDDVLPNDEGEVSQGLDQQTIKRIAGLIAGVLIAICACVILMYLI